jgi:hypothetical protein
MVTIKQQWRICEIYKGVCGNPTRLHIEENAQCNGTGPPDQIQLIHGERYMKTLVTLHLLIPVWVENVLLDLWECNFSQLY